MKSKHKEAPMQSMSSGRSCLRWVRPCQRSIGIGHASPPTSTRSTLLATSASTSALSFNLISRLRSRPPRRPPMARHDITSVRYAPWPSAKHLLLLLMLTFASSSVSSTPANDQPVAAAATGVNFRCPEQFGYYADEYNCSKYFVCVFGEALHESCTGGLRFSSELQTCDWPRNVVCPLEDIDGGYDDDVEGNEPTGGGGLPKKSAKLLANSGSGMVLESTTESPPALDNSFVYGGGFIKEDGGGKASPPATIITTTTTVAPTPPSDESILQESFDRLVKSAGGGGGGRSRGGGKVPKRLTYDLPGSGLGGSSYLDLSNIAADLVNNKLEEANSTLVGGADLNAVDDLDENFTLVDLQRQRVNIVRNGKIQASGSVVNGKSFKDSSANTIGRSINGGSARSTQPAAQSVSVVASSDTVLPELDFVFKDVRHYTSQAAKNKALTSSGRNDRLTLDEVLNLNTFGEIPIKTNNEIESKRQQQQQQHTQTDSSKFDETITALLNDRSTNLAGSVRGADEDGGGALLRIIAPLNNKHLKGAGATGPSLSAIDKALETLNFRNLTSSDVVGGKVIVFNRTQVIQMPPLAGGEGHEANGNGTSTLILIDHTTGGGGGENRKSVLSSDYGNGNELPQQQPPPPSHRELAHDRPRQAIVIRTDKSDDSSDLHLTSNNKPVIGRNRGNRTSKFSSKFLTPVTTTPASMNDDDDIDILVNGAARSLDNDFQRIRNAPPMSTTAENGKKRANTTLKAKETLISQPELRQSQYFTESPLNIASSAVTNKQTNNANIRHLGSYHRNNNNNSNNHTRSSSTTGMSSLLRNQTLQTPSRPAPLYETPQPFTPAVKCNPQFCRLPDCLCSGSSIPGGLTAKEVPQLVLLSFDDAVNDANWNIYEEILNSGRSNPNGCPIKATFYVSHEWTDYSLIQTLYSRGHEMASHSISHSFGERFTKQEWAAEHVGQREILHLYGGVNRADVRGTRAAFLQPGGDRQFEMLYDANFTYDSSMPVYENNPPLWPYTLDYSIGHECMASPCPTRSFPGVWSFGLVMWQDLSGGRCSMADTCSNPPDEQGVYDLIMKNFQRHYNSNRAPFGLFYHSAWFNNEHHRRGFLRVLDDLLSNYKDVYFVTKWEAIQWIRNPTPLKELYRVNLFSCSRDPYRPAPCLHPNICNVGFQAGGSGRVGRSGGSRYLKTCMSCPKRYPWLNDTGV